MIHDRIRRARVLRGLSLEALAQQLGDITKQGLSKFEKGLAVPNSTRLLQLAQALEVKPEYFFRSDAVALSPLEFRKRARMSKGHQEQVTERIREHLERYVALERCFEPGGLGTKSVAAHSVRAHAVEAAEDAANQLRERWEIGGDAIAHLTELLEEHGLKIALLDGPEDFDGACAATDDQQHVLIALNTRRPGERLRFTAAHELGHWVLDLPDSLTEPEKESACHRFAGALLYPKDRVLADFGTHKRSRVFIKELFNAKQRYGLSMQAALRRLKDLDLITADGYRAMHIEFSKEGWRTHEPGELKPEQPKRFESLVYRALAEDLISLSRAAEFLRCRIDQLNPSLQELAEPA
jgi:Zn-dependent peptidase ImmA (M78 family)/DNA-binding XRE family transcriptional regulator